MNVLTLANKPHGNSLSKKIHYLPIKYRGSPTIAPLLAFHLKMSTFNAPNECGSSRVFLYAVSADQKIPRNKGTM